MNHPCVPIDEKFQRIALPEHVSERPCPGLKTLNELGVGTEQEKPLLNEHLARWGFGCCGKEIFHKHKHVILRKQIFIQVFFFSLPAYAHANVALHVRMMCRHAVDYYCYFRMFDGYLSRSGI